MCIVGLRTKLSHTGTLKKGWQKWKLHKRSTKNWTNLRTKMTDCTNQSQKASSYIKNRIVCALENTMTVEIGKKHFYMKSHTFYGFSENFFCVLKEIFWLFLYHFIYISRDTFACAFLYWNHMQNPKIKSCFYSVIL